MSLDFEKLMAKVSGENTKDFAKRIISNADKQQIKFAFDQMFVGLSLLEWMKKVTLGDAWRISLDKMRDYIFSINGEDYILDYLRVSVYEHRQQTMKMLSDSEHTNEYINYPVEQFPELEKSATAKIQNAVDIIKNFLSSPHSANAENKKENIDEQILQRLNEHNREKESERERVKK